MKKLVLQFLMYGLKFGLNYAMNHLKENQAEYVQFLNDKVINLPAMNEEQEAELINTLYDAIEKLIALLNGIEWVKPEEEPKK